MLGSQGALPDRVEDDPEKVVSFAPKPTPLMTSLLALLAAGAAIGSAALVFTDRPGVFERFVLALGALFFGYCAYLAARRARTGRPASFDSRGLWIDGPRTRKVIEWNSIDSITTTSVSSQKFNVIALRDPRPLIAQYDALETKIAVGRENFVALIAAALGLGAKSAPDLAVMFADRRRQWGGEIWLSPHDRDRSADAFDTLLNAWWKKYRREQQP